MKGTKLITCPECRQELNAVDSAFAGGVNNAGTMTCPNCKTEYRWQRDIKISFSTEKVNQ